MTTDKTPQAKATVPDPTSPWTIDVLREISRRPGTMKPWVRDVPAPDDFGLEVVGVPAGEPIHLDLRLESVVEGVLASGTVSADVVGSAPAASVRWPTTSTSTSPSSTPTRTR